MRGDFSIADDEPTVRQLYYRMQRMDRMVLRSHRKRAGSARSR